MHLKINDRLKYFSNFLILLFLFLVITTSYFSHLFQNKYKFNLNEKIGSKIFSETEFDSIAKISIKNKAGEFIFEKNTNSNNSWHMTSPKDISANSVFIKDLLNSLISLKIKKIIPEDKSNYINYSFDKPSSIITMLDSSGKSFHLNFGIVNSIDSSTYLKMSNKSGYFHIDLPTPSIENANLFDFIETQIISIKMNQIKSVKVFKKDKSNSNILFSYTKNHDQWTDIQNKPTLTEKVYNYLEELLLLKSNFILENPTDSQKKTIATFQKKVEYVISIENTNSISSDFYITSELTNMPDLDLKNEEYFIIYNQSNVYYLLRKDIKDKLIKYQL